MLPKDGERTPQREMLKKESMPGAWISALRWKNLDSFQPECTVSPLLACGQRTGLSNTVGVAVPGTACHQPGQERGRQVTEHPGAAWALKPMLFLVVSAVSNLSHASPIAMVGPTLH